MTFTVGAPIRAPRVTSAAAELAQALTELPIGSRLRLGLPAGVGGSDARGYQVHVELREDGNWHNLAKDPVTRWSTPDQVVDRLRLYGGALTRHGDAPTPTDVLGAIVGLDRNLGRIADALERIAARGAPPPDPEPIVEAPHD